MRYCSDSGLLVFCLQESFFCAIGYLLWGSHEFWVVSFIVMLKLTGFLCYPHNIFIMKVHIVMLYFGPLFYYILKLEIFLLSYSVLLVMIHFFKKLFPLVYYIKVHFIQTTQNMLCSLYHFCDWFPTILAFFICGYYNIF